MAVGISTATAQTPTRFQGSVAVGSQAGPRTVSLPFSTSATIQQVLVLSQGSQGQDFVDAQTGSCKAGNTVLAGLGCTVDVVFQPKFPGSRTGAVVLIDTNKKVIATQYLQGSATGPLAMLVPGTINTVAGNGAWVYKQDDVAATQAAIFLPMGVVVDAAGNLFLSDSSNNRVRRVDAKTGVITTYAGTGTPGFSGDGGAATAAQISNPAGLAIDGADNLYVADSGNHAIRKIESATGIISTVAGVGGQQGFVNTPMAATAALLSFPDGIAFDAARNLYIADTGNNAIRRVDAGTGVMTTIAGTGTAGYNGDNQAATAALLNNPWSIAVTDDGQVYIADLSNNRIRLVNAAGTITTVAGTGDRSFSGDTKLATQAQLSNPAAVMLDRAGNLYIGDSGNNRIRRIMANTGIITTFSGTDSQQFGGDGGTADKATMYGPYALFSDGPGNIYFSDMFHNRIREISATGALLQYATIRVTRTSPSQLETVENDGNADMQISALPLVNATLDPATTTCTATSLLKTEENCALGVAFTPQTVGDPITGTAGVQSNSANGQVTVTLSGTVLTVEPSTTILKSSANPSTFGQPLIFTANVTSAASAVTGTVQFLDGTTVLGTVNLSSSGSATYTTSNLALGAHTITASYSGDSSNAASVSTVLNQSIKQPATVALTSALNPSVATQNVTFTAKVSAANGQPTGQVTFTDNDATLGSVALISGSASFSTAALTVGSHTIVASYEGDTNDASNTAQLTQTVNQSKTTTLASANPTTIPVGTSVTFSATVTSNDGLKPTGTVTFYDGKTSLGAVRIDDSGQASYSTTALTPTSATNIHTITATYSGDADNVTSTSPGFTETVQQLATVTTVSSDTQPANAGATIHLTALVGPGTNVVPDGAISGSVIFKEGTATLGTATVGSDGRATLALSTLSVGQHTIVATYQGNTNYATSSSTDFGESINQTSTTTALASSASSIIAGKPITLTATVTSLTGTPTGTVVFTDGGAIVGQGTLTANGTASIQTSTLAVSNSHSIIATYKGDSNYTTSTSTALPETVLIATTTATLSSSANPVEVGVPVTLTALLSTNGGTATGTLTIRDGQTVLASAPATTGTPLVFTTSSLTVGTHTLTAEYTGDANNSPSTSIPVSENVTLAATQVALRSSLSPSVLNQSVTFTATVSTRSSTPTGKITFSDGTTPLGSVTIDATGSASFPITTLTPGAHIITAAYAGDTTHSASTSTAITQQVIQQVTASLTSSANPSIAGSPLTFTIHVTGIQTLVPTGRVTLMDGAQNLGSVTLDATGSATFTSSTLAVGQHNIVANYGGDESYSSISSGVLQQVVRASLTQVALTSSANPGTFGTAIVLTAKVSGETGVPSGTITFSDGGASLGRSTLSNGVATLSVSTLSAGNHTLTASYNGDANDGTAVSPALTEQVQRTTTVSLASSLNPALRLDSVLLTASVSNGTTQLATGTITFKDGAAVLATVNLDANGVATFTSTQLSAATHAITAVYSGDTADFASTSTALQQSVQLRPTTTALTATTTISPEGLQVTLISVLRWTPAANSTTSPTGTFTYLSGTKTLGVSQVDTTGVGTLTIVLDAQSASITAQYSGDSVYAPASSPATTVSNGTPSQFTLQSSLSTVQLQSKQHTTVDVTVNSVQNFADTLSFGCLGLPFGATCTFSSDQMALKANGSGVVHLTIDTGSPLTAGEQASLHTGDSARLANGLTLCTLLPGAPMLLLLARRRSRMTRLLMLCAAVALLTAGLSGCGGLNINGTPPGTYHFKITASGNNTGLTSSADITLTVTQ